MLQMRDDMADALGIATLKAQDSAMRWLLTSFLQRAQNWLYRQYRSPDFSSFWQFNTAANVNLYAVPGAVTLTWAASTPFTFNVLVFDGVNYQMVTMAGTTGATTPTWATGLNGITTDGSVTWINLGPTVPMALNGHMVTSAWVVYNMAWLKLTSGIQPQGYTLIAPMYPRRYQLRNANYFELWPTPDNVYTIQFQGYQALPSFAADTDTPMLPDELVLLFALAFAKAHHSFKQPDASMALAAAKEYLNALRNESLDGRRFVPGMDGDMVVRPMPVIVNPEIG